MKESFSGKRHEDAEEVPQMNRRRFLTGAASTALSLAAGAGVIKLALEKDSMQQAYDSFGVEDIINQQSVHEHTHSFEDFTNSKNFITEVVNFSDAYEKELPEVLDFIRAATQKDPEGRNRMDYLREMFHAEGVPQKAMDELKKQIVGLAFEESRFDAARVSSSGAQSILQIMKSTWDEHAKEGEEIHSLVDQTRVAGELLSQTYRHLSGEVGGQLQLIKEVYFDNNDEQFERYFLAPVLINSYNAGMGNMGHIVGWFMQAYPTRESTIGIFDEQKAVSGHDVFLAMVKQFETTHPSSSYKEQASTYTSKAYGAALCLLRQNPELFK